jgi:hypothetical protein
MIARLLVATYEVIDFPDSTSSRQLKHNLQMG